MRSVASVAVFALAVMRAAGAGAAGPQAWLEWSSSSSGCGDAAAFAERVEHALGRSPARAAAEAKVSVTVNVTAHPAAATADARWVGEVRLRGDDQRSLGARTIDRRDASCQPLIEAMALVTALALADDGIVSPRPADPAEQGGLVGAPPLPAPAPEPAAPPVTVSPAPPTGASEPAPPESLPAAPRAEPAAALSASPSRAPSSRRWRSGVEGGAKLGVGLLPRVAFGAELSGYLRTASGWRMFLAFTGWQRQTSLDGAGRGASFQRLEVGLGLCPLTATGGRWDVAACLQGDLGRLTVAGVGFLPSSSSTQDRLVLDAGVGAALSRRLSGPLAVGLNVAVTAPLIRDQIGYGTTDGGEISIFREAPVAFIGSLRLSVVF